LQPDLDEVTFVNAGHNSPLLVRSDGTGEELEASGMMIGAFDFAGWSEQKVKLGAGDLLFIYTDGVSEAETATGDMYGEERMTKLVCGNRLSSAADIAESLVRDIRVFVKDAPSSDDITMMIIKREV
jgi:sigma-B regulation protein RsbU (phosphoserine phosphatase)